VSVRTLDTWQEHADLMRIESVTPQIANTLNLIGIKITIIDFLNVYKND